MSERELQRIEVLSKVLERRMTVVSAAHVLDMTTCQVQRLLKAFRAEGAAALRHKARGRRSNHQLVREHYLDFGPTFAAEKLAAEKLAERDGLRVRLAAQPIPHLSGNYVSVVRAGLEAGHDAALKADLALGTDVLGEFLAADTVVLGVAQYNLSVPASLRRGSIVSRSQAKPSVTRKRDPKAWLAANASS